MAQDIEDDIDDLEPVSPGILFGVEDEEETEEDGVEIDDDEEDTEQEDEEEY
jgi:hypothetical protein